MRPQHDPNTLTTRSQKGGNIYVQKVIFCVFPGGRGGAKHAKTAVSVWYVEAGSIDGILKRKCARMLMVCSSTNAHMGPGNKGAPILAVPSGKKLSGFRSCRIESEVQKQRNVRALVSSLFYTILAQAVFRGTLRNDPIPGAVSSVCSVFGDF